MSDAVMMDGGRVWPGPDWAKLASFEDNVPSFLAACAAAYRDETLLVFEGERISYGEAEARSARLAQHLLGAGYGKGQRIGMILPNSPDFAVVWLAIARIGAVAVPISTLYTPQELGAALRDADLAMLIAVDRFQKHDYGERLELALGLAGRQSPMAREAAPFLREIRLIGEQRDWSRPLECSEDPLVSPEILAAAEMRVAPCDPACIIYTSGSTSAPKGVIHSHGSVVRAARKMAAMMPYERGTRQLSASPMFWVGGLIAAWLAAMPVGATTIFSAARGSAMLDLIEREQANYVFVWPHVAQQLEADPSFADRDFSTILGGNLVAAIPPHLRQRNQVFGGALGMTETAGPHTATIPHLPDEMIGSYGPSAPGMQHRIVDPESRQVLPEGMEGELEVKGDTLMLGYVGKQRSEFLTADGWFATGDRCRIHRGCVFFLGRVDDMIKCAGANVWPGEVEAALRQLPDVAAAYITGVRDVARGTSVGAAVVLAPSSRLTEADISAHAVRMLSTYKVPRVIWVCRQEDLPLTGSNKIERRQLAAMLEMRAVDASRQPAPQQ